MTVHQNIASRLNSGDRLSEQECTELLREVQAELARIAPRMTALHPGDGMTERGKERKRALLSGTPEDLLNLRDEFDRLQAEHDQLDAQRRELSERRARARIHEAFEAMPTLQEKLRAKLAVAEAAQHALEAALDDIEATYQGIVRARGQCHHGGLDTVGTDAETIGRLLRLAPLSVKGRVAMQQDAGRHRENLGFDHLAKPAACAA